MRISKIIFFAAAILAVGVSGVFAQEPASGSEGVTIDLVAEDIAFDKDTITVPAGASVTVNFTNMDAVPHNFSVYMSSDMAEAVFEGEIIAGPDESIQYEFTAPEEAGTYFFVCDIHPRTMTGDFIVE